MYGGFKIVTGRISERGMWPWQIGIYRNYNGTPLFLCGGALVSRLWVLTAAHCFYDESRNFNGNASMYLIKAGDHNLSIYETSQQEIAPEMIFAHHEFESSSTVDGDIALIKLSRKVELNMFVKTVCLPEEREGDLAIPHTIGTVTGWGITQNLTYEESKHVSHHDISKVLRHVHLKIQSDHLCLNKADMTYNSTMTFCAGDGKGGSDACKGDSGGAFVRQIRRGTSFKRWVVIGVVSWGKGCAQKDQYGYYTRVYPFVGWIKKTINDGILSFSNTPPETVYLVKGSDAVFVWDYSKTDELQSVVWKVYNKTQGAFEILRIEDENGTRLLVNDPAIPPAAYIGRLERNGTATLIIKDITFEDSTRFKFTLTGKPGVQDIDDNVDLVVTGEASVQDSVQFAEIGASVTCTCKVTSVPSQYIQWKRQGQAGQITDDAKHLITSPGAGSSQLTIKNISVADRGYYFCNASVSVIQPSLASCYVEVLSPVKQEDTICRTRYFSVGVGEELSICCPVSGYPPPVVTWEKNGAQLQKGENRNYIITAVKDEDFGNYSCTATDGKSSIGPFNSSVTKIDGSMVFTKKPPSTVYVKKGSNAVLKWEYNVDRNPAELKFITWKVLVKALRKYKEMIVEDDGIVSPHPGLPAAYVHRVEKKGQATLIVKNVTFEDSTKFQCVLTLYGGVTKKGTVELIVTGDASVQDPVQFAEIGASVTCTCNATGVPSQYFQWKRQGRAEQITNDAKHLITFPGAGSSQLTIKSISVADQGYYVCDASVNVNQPSSASCYVQVVSPVKQDDTFRLMRSYTVGAGEQLSICCPVSGYPPPVVTWEKNGVQLQKGENTKYTITAVKDEDFGNYSCIATDGKCSIGPFDSSVTKIAELAVTSTDGSVEKAARLKWEQQNGTDHHLLLKNRNKESHG